MICSYSEELTTTLQMAPPFSRMITSSGERDSFLLPSVSFINTNAVKVLGFQVRQYFFWLSVYESLINVLWSNLLKYCWWWTLMALTSTLYFRTVYGLYGQRRLK